MANIIDYTERIDAILDKWYAKNDMRDVEDSWTNTVVTINCDYVLDIFYAKYPVLDEDITEEELVKLLDDEFDAYAENKLEQEREDD